MKQTKIAPHNRELFLSKAKHLLRQFYTHFPQQQCFVYLITENSKYKVIGNFLDVIFECSDFFDSIKDAEDSFCEHFQRWLLNFSKKNAFSQYSWFIEQNDLLKDFDFGNNENTLKKVVKDDVLNMKTTNELSQNQNNKNTLQKVLKDHVLNIKTTNELSQNQSNNGFSEKVTKDHVPNIKTTNELSQNQNNNGFSEKVTKDHVLNMKTLNGLSQNQNNKNTLKKVVKDDVLNMKITDKPSENQNNKNTSKYMIKDDVLNMKITDKPSENQNNKNASNNVIKDDVLNIKTTNGPPQNLVLEQTRGSGNEKSTNEELNILETDFQSQNPIVESPVNVRVNENDISKNTNSAYDLGTFFVGKIQESNSDSQILPRGKIPNAPQNMNSHESMTDYIGDSNEENFSVVKNLGDKQPRNGHQTLVETQPDETKNMKGPLLPKDKSHFEKYTLDSEGAYSYEKSSSFNFEDVSKTVNRISFDVNEIPSKSNVMNENILNLSISSDLSFCASSNIKIPKVKNLFKNKNQSTKEFCSMTKDTLSYNNSIKCLNKDSSEASCSMTKDTLSHNNSFKCSKSQSTNQSFSMIKDTLSHSNSIKRSNKDSSETQGLEIPEIEPTKILSEKVNRKEFSLLESFKNEERDLQTNISQENLLFGEASNFADKKKNDSLSIVTLGELCQTDHFDRDLTQNTDHIFDSKNSIIPLTESINGKYITSTLNQANVSKEDLNESNNQLYQSTVGHIYKNRPPRNHDFIKCVEFSQKHNLSENILILNIYVFQLFAKTADFSNDLNFRIAKLFQKLEPRFNLQSNLAFRSFITTLNLDLILQRIDPIRVFDFLCKNLRAKNILKVESQFFQKNHVDEKILTKQDIFTKGQDFKNENFDPNAGTCKNTLSGGTVTSNSKESCFQNQNFNLSTASKDTVQPNKNTLCGFTNKRFKKTHPSGQYSEKTQQTGRNFNEDSLNLEVFKLSESEVQIPQDRIGQNLNEDSSNQELFQLSEFHENLQQTGQFDEDSLNHELSKLSEFHENLQQTSQFKESPANQKDVLKLSESEVRILQDRIGRNSNEDSSNHEIPKLSESEVRILQDRICPNLSSSPQKHHHSQDQFLKTHPFLQPVDFNKEITFEKLNFNSFKGVLKMIQSHQFILDPDTVEIFITHKGGVFKCTLKIGNENFFGTGENHPIKAFCKAYTEALAKKYFGGQTRFTFDFIFEKISGEFDQKIQKCLFFENKKCLVKINDTQTESSLKTADCSLDRRKREKSSVSNISSKNQNAFALMKNNGKNKTQKQDVHVTDEKYEHSYNLELEIYGRVLNRENESISRFNPIYQEHTQKAATSSGLNRENDSISRLNPIYQEHIQKAATSSGLNQEKDSKYTSYLDQIPLLDKTSYRTPFSVSNSSYSCETNSSEKITENLIKSEHVQRELKLVSHEKHDNENPGISIITTLESIGKENANNFSLCPQFMYSDFGTNNNFMKNTVQVPGNRKHFLNSFKKEQNSIDGNKTRFSKTLEFSPSENLEEEISSHVDRKTSTHSLKSNSRNAFDRSQNKRVAFSLGKKYVFDTFGQNTHLKYIDTQQISPDSIEGTNLGSRNFESQNKLAFSLSKECVFDTFGQNIHLKSINTKEMSPDSIRDSKLGSRNFEPQIRKVRPPDTQRSRYKISLNQSDSKESVSLQKNTPFNNNIGQSLFADEQIDSKTAIASNKNDFQFLNDQSLYDNQINYRFDSIKLKDSESFQKFSNIKLQSLNNRNVSKPKKQKLLLEDSMSINNKERTHLIYEKSLFNPFSTQPVDSARFISLPSRGILNEKKDLVFLKSPREKLIKGNVLCPNHIDSMKEDGFKSDSYHNSMLRNGQCDTEFDFHCGLKKQDHLQKFRDSHGDSMLRNGQCDTELDFHCGSKKQDHLHKFRDYHGDNMLRNGQCDTELDFHSGLEKQDHLHKFRDSHGNNMLRNGQCDTELDFHCGLKKRKVSENSNKVFSESARIAKRNKSDNKLHPENTFERNEEFLDSRICHADLSGSVKNTPHGKRRPVLSNYECRLKKFKKDSRSEAFKDLSRVQKLKILNDLEFYHDTRFSKNYPSTNRNAKVSQIDCGKKPLNSERNVFAPESKKPNRTFLKSPKNSKEYTDRAHKPSYQDFEHINIHDKKEKEPRLIELKYHKGSLDGKNSTMCKEHQVHNSRNMRKLSKNENSDSCFFDQKMDDQVSASLEKKNLQKTSQLGSGKFDFPKQNFYSAHSFYKSLNSNNSQNHQSSEINGPRNLGNSVFCIKNSKTNINTSQNKTNESHEKYERTSFNSQKNEFIPVIEPLGKNHCTDSVRDSLTEKNDQNMVDSKEKCLNLQENRICGVRNSHFDISLCTNPKIPQGYLGKLKRKNKITDFHFRRMADTINVKSYISSKNYDSSKKGEYSVQNNRQSQKFYDSCKNENSMGREDMPYASDNRTGAQKFSDNDKHGVIMVLDNVESQKTPINGTYFKNLNLDNDFEISEQCIRSYKNQNEQNQLSIKEKKLAKSPFKNINQSCLSQNNSLPCDSKNDPRLDTKEPQTSLPSHSESQKSLKGNNLSNRVQMTESQVFQTIDKYFPPASNIKKGHKRTHEVKIIDYTKKLNSMCLQLGLDVPEYTIEKQNDVFICSASLDGQSFTSRYFFNKEEARQDVCNMIMRTLLSQHNYKKLLHENERDPETPKNISPHEDSPNHSCFNDSVQEVSQKNEANNCRMSKQNGNKSSNNHQFSQKNCHIQFEEKKNVCKKQTENSCTLNHFPEAEVDILTTITQEEDINQKSDYVNQNMYFQNLDIPHEGNDHSFKHQKDKVFPTHSSKNRQNIHTESLIDLQLEPQNVDQPDINSNACSEFIKGVDLPSTNLRSVDMGDNECEIQIRPFPSGVPAFNDFDLHQLLKDNHLLENQQNVIKDSGENTDHESVGNFSPLKMDNNYSKKPLTHLRQPKKQTSRSKQFSATKANYVQKLLKKSKSLKNIAKPIKKNTR